MKIRAIAIGLVLSCLFPALLHAQGRFTVGGREVQFHGFLSQGFASSTDNNYLTMETSEGHWFTEAGLNVSSQVTHKFRLGAQIYDRSIGELGKGKVYLDWAQADYRFEDWIGFRAGKIKTRLGLYTDTQDQAFLHTWALLPQSVYPADLRSETVAHVGGDIYGNIDIPRGGLISYTGFAGSIPDDKQGGFRYGAEDLGQLTTGIMGRIAGVDLRWTTPIDGLMVGSSLVYSHRRFKGYLDGSPVLFSYESKFDRIIAMYGDYTWGNFRADAEYRYQKQRGVATAEAPGRPVVGKPGAISPAWFVSGAYRISKWVEVGSYYSDYRVTRFNAAFPPGPDEDHIYDTAVTVRFDPAEFWVFKMEGHFMDGVGPLGSAHGFYPQDNPQGLEPTTRMLVLRSSWYF